MKHEKQKVFVPCCQRPESLPGVPSPFTKIIALGFYDGPTSGVTQCETCSTAYRFDMLDWDGEQEVRIFRLAELPANSLDRCVRVLANAGLPRWPFWAPRLESLPTATREAVNERIHLVLDSAQPPMLVVAWVRYGAQILAAMQVSDTNLANIPDWFSLDESAATRDWFGELGLPKSVTAGNR